MLKLHLFYSQLYKTLWNKTVRKTWGKRVNIQKSEQHVIPTNRGCVLL